MGISWKCWDKNVISAKNKSIVWVMLQDKNAKKEEVDTWMIAYFVLKNPFTKGDKWNYQLENGIELEGHKWTPSKTLKDKSN